VKSALGILHAIRPAEALRLTDPSSGRKPGHDAVRPPLELTVFFEKLAGNHAGGNDEG
jgi:hypothetical protein